MNNLKQPFGFKKATPMCTNPFIKSIILSFVLICLAGGINAQVNLQNGAAQANFPLYNIQDSKSGLGLNVSLNYVDGNGINVNEIASDAGTGWLLNVGGQITRTVAGQPDDQMYPGTLPTDDYDFLSGYPTYFPNGFLYSPYAAGSTVPGFGGQHLLEPQNTVIPNLRPALQTSADREQDIFTFSFNGRQGQFYIGRDKSIMQTVNSKLKISFQEQDMTAQNIRTRINQFVITDENGVIYTFSDMELNTIMNYSVNASALVNSYHVYDGNYTPPGNSPAPQYLPLIVNTWRLTSIKNPFTSDEINFIYSLYNVDMIGARHLVEEYVSGSSTVNYTMNRDHYVYTAKRISRINFPNHQSLVFSYNSLARVDLPGDNALNTIALVSNYLGTDKTENYYQFNFGYFFQNQIEPYNYAFSSTQASFARLCLQSFQKYSADGSLNIPPTSFSYNLSIPGLIGYVPPQFSLNKDMWGYYSTVGYQAAAYTDNVSVGSFKTPDNTNQLYNIDANYAELGLISNIVYPTGGSLSFTYEQNKTSDSNIPNNLAPGVRVSSVSSNDGNGNVKQTTYKYLKSDETTSSGRGFEVPVGSTTQLTRVYKTTNSQLAYEIKDVVSAYIKYEIAISGATAEVAGVAVTGSTFSTLYASEALFIAIYDLIQYIIYTVAPAYQDENILVTYYDNQNTNSLPIMYSRVEVQEVYTTVTNGTTNTFTNGKTVYQFTSLDDYPALLTTFTTIPNSNSPLFTSQQRVGSWQYGLTKAVQYYDNTVSPTNPIKEVINTYTPYVTTYNNSSYESTVWAANTTSLTPVGYSSLSLPSSYITSVSYYPTNGRTELTTTVENTYDKNGNKFSKTTNYFYNSTNYQVNKTETFNTSNSNEVFGSSVYYPSDYDPSINLTSALTSANLYNLPVTTAQYKKYGTNSPILTGATANIFTQLSDGEIKVAQVYGFETAAPVSNSFITSFSSTTLPSSYSYLALKKSMAYDGASGTLLSSTQNGQTESYITSYAGRYTIAKAFNCAYSNIAYTGFEDNNNGNWNYAAASVINTAYKTGVASFQLSTSPTVTIASTQTLTSGTTYTVSLWLKTGSGTCTVNGTSVNQVLTNSDGWTYCTLNVSGVTSITLAGTGIIDELRLYPNGAQMTSYSYDLMKGITSQADANSRIAYNQYDGLGRLDVVLDQNKNIVKKYSYNYAGQQANYVGTVFNNQAVSQTFQRNNCTTGYTGTFVTYNVPANTYTSVISQADANNQALNGGQNYANTNGACVQTATITGQTSFDATTSSGNGEIAAPAGYVVTVSISAGGPGTPQSTYTLSVSIPGVTISLGSTSITNASNGQFQFTMPSSGIVNYTATFTQSTSDGSGSISVR